MGVKLSIIVPVYGVAKYLPKCVDSLLAQDISDYEIILVDDGSPDECPEICDQYAASYPSEFKGERVEVIGEENGNAEITPRSHIASSPYRPTIKVVHQANAGLSAARNTGIAAAQGDYILFVDSDDYLQSNVLGTLMTQVKRDNLDVLRFRYQNVRECGEVFMPHEGMKTDYNNYSSKPVDGLTFLNDCMWVQCYVVQFIIKTDIVRQELFTPGIYFEDVDWTPRMLQCAKRVASTELVVYNYLWREGSITLSQKDITKMRKQLQDKLALIAKLNQLGHSVVNRKWFDSMISGLVINVVGIVSQYFYEQRKEYIRAIKALAVLPITDYHIAPKAKWKVKLINTSIDLAVILFHAKR